MEKGEEINMSKKLTCLFIVLFFVFLAVFSYAQQDAESKGAEIIVIEKGRMPQVTFPHHEHQKTLENNCNACHDLFPKQPGIIKQLIVRKTLYNKQVMNSKCLKCHKDRKAAGKKAGPTRCLKNTR